MPVLLRAMFGQIYKQLAHSKCPIQPTPYESPLNRQFIPGTEFVGK